jgi:hypothetical protein
MSEKKQSSKKEPSVDVMPSVIAPKRPQKTDRPSPVQDHEWLGSGGLLSHTPVHGGRGDGEDIAAAQGSESRDSNVLRSS